MLVPAILVYAAAIAFLLIAAALALAIFFVARILQNLARLSELVKEGGEYVHERLLFINELIS